MPIIKSLSTAAAASGFL